MTEPEELEDDLFADLYEGDDHAPAAKPIPEPPVQSAVPVENVDVSTSKENYAGHFDGGHDPEQAPQDEVMQGSEQAVDASGAWGNSTKIETTNGQGQDTSAEEEPRPIGIKEDGKMFIGGLNWETTDHSLKEYFSKFGEVQECTVMRDGATGRSRGFGFLTFKDPRTVNVVMVKEHYLDGKIIDPKRAIPRDEQERTSKIFVGGVSQEATEQVFKEYFAQYGRVVDATLMMDKDTGRPRGFGFVTFDSEASVENALQGDLTILGKPIEVKKAQPRGNIREDEDSLGRGGRGRGRGRDFNNNDNNQNNNQNNMMQGQQVGNGMMTPQMMAQYWARMQQYFSTMQQQMAAATMQGGGMGAMGGMNPAMMQQMQQMQQLQQMKAMQMAQQQQQQQQGRGSQSPMPDAQNSMQNAMMQQMQAMQAQMGGGMGGGMGMGMGMGMGGQGMGGGNVGGGGGGGGGANSGNGGGQSGRRGTPGFNAQDQLAFEQQKYEQQQARRAAHESQPGQSYAGGGGPTSWEGMYDDVPQPNSGPRGRGGGPGKSSTPNPANAPPANAPTGPKNAGKPGANYRGGHGGRGSHRGYHPYAR